MQGHKGHTSEDAWQEGSACGWMERNQLRQKQCRLDGTINGTPTQDASFDKPEAAISKIMALKCA